MKTNVIKIGNSKGIRIPKALLLESGLGSEVELKVKRGEIKIVALDYAAREAWSASDTAVMSEKVLGRDWNRPEEDKAWASLQ